MELKRGDSDKRLPAGGTIPLERTEPALDLDALIGGFRPLFRALDPDKVNNIAQSIITIFQGQGGTINDILDQTASLTSALADRDQAIGEVIKNLNTVLDTTVKHQQQFDDTLVELREADHRPEEPRGSDREFGRQHQRRGGHGRRPARRQPAAAAEHSRPARGSAAAAGGPEGSTERHPCPAAHRVQDHRPRRWHLRRLLQLLFVRYLVEAQRLAAGRACANSQAHQPAFG